MLTIKKFNYKINKESVYLFTYPSTGFFELLLRNCKTYCLNLVDYGPLNDLNIEMMDHLEDMGVFISGGVKDLNCSNIYELKEINNELVQSMIGEVSNYFEYARRFK